MNCQLAAFAHVGLAAMAASGPRAALAQSCEPEQLIQNGSFESPTVASNNNVLATPTSWNWGSGPIGFIFNGNNGYPWPGPSHLSQFADIGNVNAPLFQHFVVNEQSTCYLTWVDNAATVSIGASPYSVRVTNSESSVVYQASYNSGNAGVWQARSITLNLPAGLYTLAFQSNGVPHGFDSLIDNVSLRRDQTARAVIRDVAVNACSTGQVQFNVEAYGTGPFSYLWQWQPAGPGTEWNALTNGPLVINGITWGTISDATTATLRAQPDPLTYYVGSVLRFRCIVTNSCGSVTSNPATLTICRCLDCPADFNQDGGTDGADVGEFFAAWEGGMCDADVNADGGVDGDDVSTFFAAWEAGGC